MIEITAVAPMRYWSLLENHASGYVKSLHPTPIPTISWAWPPYWFREAVPPHACKSTEACLCHNPISFHNWNHHNLLEAANAFQAVWFITVARHVFTMLNKKNRDFLGQGASSYVDSNSNSPITLAYPMWLVSKYVIFITTNKLAAMI